MKLTLWQLTCTAALLLTAADLQAQQQQKEGYSSAAAMSAASITPTTTSSSSAAHHHHQQAFYSKASTLVGFPALSAFAARATAAQFALSLRSINSQALRWLFLSAAALVSWGLLNQEKMAGLVRLARSASGDAAEDLLVSSSRHTSHGHKPEGGLLLPWDEQHLEELVADYIDHPLLRPFSSDDPQLKALIHHLAALDDAQLREALANLMDHYHSRKSFAYVQAWSTEELQLWTMQRLHSYIADELDASYEFYVLAAMLLNSQHPHGAVQKVSKLFPVQNHNYLFREDAVERWLITGLRHYIKGAAASLDH